MNRPLRSPEEGRELARTLARDRLVRIGGYILAFAVIAAVLFWSRGKRALPPDCAELYGAARSAADTLRVDSIPVELGEVRRPNLPPATCRSFRTP